MIQELLMAAMGPASVGPIVYVVSRRAHKFRTMVHQGVQPHIFNPGIIRTPTEKILSKWCRTCNQKEHAWIHRKGTTVDLVEKSLPELERADIKWRFENDPGWVKVFGVEYDPKTFVPIPQHHNGECGGALDSCPRCNWEVDQAKAEEKEKRLAQEAAFYNENRARTEKENTEFKEEIKGYSDLLDAVWGGIHDREEALEEWEDLLDDIGMLENDTLRRKIKELNDFKRLSYLLAKDANRNWSRREEIWQNKLKNDRQYRKHRDYPY